MMVMSSVYVVALSVLLAVFCVHESVGDIFGIGKTLKKYNITCNDDDINALFPCGIRVLKQQQAIKDLQHCKFDCSLFDIAASCVKEDLDSMSRLCITSFLDILDKVFGGDLSIIKIPCNLTVTEIINMCPDLPTLPVWSAWTSQTNCSCTVKHHSRTRHCVNVLNPGQKIDECVGRDVDVTLCTPQEHHTCSAPVGPTLLTGLLTAQLLFIAVAKMEYFWT